VARTAIPAKCAETRISSDSASMNASIVRRWRDPRYQPLKVPRYSASAVQELCHAGVENSFGEQEKQQRNKQRENCPTGRRAYSGLFFPLLFSHLFFISASGPVRKPGEKSQRLPRRLQEFSKVIGSRSIRLRNPLPRENVSAARLGLTFPHTLAQY
jgi:hypothetical protein